MRPAALRGGDRAERAKPANVKQQVIDERGFKNLRLRAEHVAEIEYRPAKCERDYRLIICRKTIDVEMRPGQALGGVPLLLLHHQRPADARGGTGACRPIDAATRRT